jgi:hypothetical protein
MVRIAITAFGVANKIKSLCGLPSGVKLDTLNMNICKEIKEMKVCLCTASGWFKDKQEIEINTMEELMELVIQKGEPIIVAEPDWASASELPTLIVYDDYIE